MNILKIFAWIVYIGAIVLMAFGHDTDTLLLIAIWTYLSGMDENEIS